MSKSSRVHHYPRSLRTVSMVDQSFAQDKGFFYVIPPDRSLSIESVHVRLRFEFDSGVSAPDRVITHVGIADEVPTNIGDEPNRLVAYEINEAADGDRIVDISMDLTPLLKKDDIALRDLYTGNDVTGHTYIYFKTSDATRGATTGTIKVCKADCLFTTEGIA